MTPLRACPDETNGNALNVYFRVYQPPTRDSDESPKLGPQIGVQKRLVLFVCLGEQRDLSHPQSLVFFFEKLPEFGRLWKRRIYAS
jgi:hypothetical protein